MNFYTRISKYYNQIFPLHKAQISFVESCVDSNTNKNLLDIGCGTGLLPIALSKKYNSISAIDTNNEMLDIARLNSAGMNIDFRDIGMLEAGNYFKSCSFDIILCFGNTVVHLQTIEEITYFFVLTRRLLNTGGKFLFQIINYDNILDNCLKGLPTIENDLIKFERNYSLDAEGRIDFTTVLTIKDSEEVIKNNVKLFPLRKAVAEALLGDAGYETIVAYSSFKKAPYNPESLPLVFECY